MDPPAPERAKASLDEARAPPSPRRRCSRTVEERLHAVAQRAFDSLGASNSTPTMVRRDRAVMGHPSRARCRSARPSQRRTRGRCRHITEGPHRDDAAAHQLGQLRRIRSGAGVRRRLGEGPRAVVAVAPARERGTLRRQAQLAARFGHREIAGRHVAAATARLALFSRREQRRGFGGSASLRIGVADARRRVARPERVRPRFAIAIASRRALVALACIARDCIARRLCAAVGTVRAPRASLAASSRPRRGVSHPLHPPCRNRARAAQPTRTSPAVNAAAPHPTCCVLGRHAVGPWVLVMPVA